MDQQPYKRFVENLDSYAFNHGAAVDLTGIDSRALQNVANRGRLGAAAQAQVGRGGRREYTGRQLIEILLINQLLRLQIPIGESVKAIIFTLTERTCGQLRAISANETLLKSSSFIHEITVLHSGEDGELVSYVVPSDATSADQLSGGGAKIIFKLGQAVFMMAVKYGLQKAQFENIEALTEDEVSRLAASLDQPPAWAKS